MAKYIEYVKASITLLQTIDEHGGEIDDYKYLTAYDDYLQMKASTSFTEAAIYAILCTKYGLAVKGMKQVFERYSMCF